MRARHTDLRWLVLIALAGCVKLAEGHLDAGYDAASDLAADAASDARVDMTDIGADAMDVGDATDVGDAMDIGDATDVSDAPDAPSDVDVAADVATDATDAGADASDATLDARDGTSDAPSDTASDAVACDAGMTLCGGVCRSLDHDPSNCGACGNVCPSAGGGSGACNARRCTVMCPLGQLLVGEVCEGVASPRPIAPLSGMTLTSQRAVFRWEPSPTATSFGAAVQVCRDRECTSIETTITAPVGTTTVTSGDLAPGRHFWRVVAAAGSMLAAPTTATWSLFVKRRGAARASANPLTLDVTGDGFADVAIPCLSTTSHNRGDVCVYYGGATPFARVQSLPDLGTMTSTPPLPRAASDLNGDGFGDLAVGHFGTPGTLSRIDLYYGASGGLSRTPAAGLASPGTSTAFAPSLSGLGDVNGDGYGDLVVASGGASYMFPGSATGLVVSPGIPLGSGAATAVGDVDADGFCDALLNNGGTFTLFRGSPAGLVPTMPTFGGPSGSSGSGFGTAVAAAGDVNADGYADVVFGSLAFRNAHLATSTGSAPWFTTPMPLTSMAGWGSVVVGLGDVNGDGADDYGAGVYLTSATPPTAFFTVYLPPPGNATISFEEPGTDVSWVGLYGFGDVNGDAYADVVASRSTDAWVYLGTAAGPSTTPGYSLSP